MRPEKAYAQVGNAIQKTLRDRNVNHLRAAKPAILKLLSKCIKNDDDLDKYYDDTSIGHLMYISDRYNCSGRLRWLLYVIDEGELTGEL